MTEPNPGYTSLDHAWALRLRGERESALRLAASVLVATPQELGAATLVARLLLDADRAEAAGHACQVLVPAYTARGDLPGACYVAHLALEAGGYCPNALRELATAFGKGSPRLADVTIKPPPFPSQVSVAPHFGDASGPALLDAAEQALAHFSSQVSQPDAGAPVPRMPLFSELEPSVLVRLLGAFEVRELQAGAYLATEGEPGQHAFVLVHGLINVVRGPEHTRLAALGPGAIFGEMALVSAAPRAASLVAVEPVVVLSISRKHLEGLSAQDPALGRELGAFCHRRMVSNLVRHSAFFSCLEREDRRALVKRFTPQSYRRGTTLLEQGGENSRLLLVASGLVHVKRHDGDGDTVLLASLGPGEVVGEISVILRRPASADVVTAQPTVTLELSAEAFQDAIKDHPALLQKLYELALHREEETRSVVAQEPLDVSDVVLV